MTARSARSTDGPEPTSAVRGAYGAAVGPPAAPTARQRRRHAVRSGVQRVRVVLAQVVWLACLAAAISLLLGALLVTVGANQDNALVAFVLQAADWADLGVFSRIGGIKEFTGEGAAVRDAAVNWGIGAVAWLVVGRLASRLLRGSRA